MSGVYEASFVESRFVVFTEEVVSRIFVLDYDAVESPHDLFELTRVVRDESASSACSSWFGVEVEEVLEGAGLALLELVASFEQRVFAVVAGGEPRDEGVRLLLAGRRLGDELEVALGVRVDDPELVLLELFERLALLVEGFVLLNELLVIPVE